MVIILDSPFSMLLKLNSRLLTTYNRLFTILLYQYYHVTCIGAPHFLHDSTWETVIKYVSVSFIEFLFITYNFLMCLALHCIHRRAGRSPVGVKSSFSPSLDESVCYLNCDFS